MGSGDTPSGPVMTTVTVASAVPEPSVTSTTNVSMLPPDSGSGVYVKSPLFSSVMTAAPCVPSVLMLYVSVAVLHGSSGKLSLAGVSSSVTRDRSDSASGTPAAAAVTAS